MILLNKGEINNVAVTVSDILPRQDGSYTLTATHVTSNKEYTISLSRINSDVIRYDEFEIDESLHDMELGFYNYEISDVSGDIADYGKLLVKGDEPTVTEYERTDNTKTMYQG